MNSIVISEGKNGAERENFFEGITNYEDLKKAYISLVKEYHPDNHPEDLRPYYTELCSKITEEYLRLSKLFRDRRSSLFTGDKKYQNACMSPYDFFSYISRELKKLPIYRKYYSADYDYCSFEHMNIGYGEYSSDDTSLIDLSTETGKAINKAHINYIQGIEGLENICLDQLKLSMDEVEVLFSLCDSNAEKFKRVVAFLSTLAIPSWDIHGNLASENPIPFFNDDIIEEDIPGIDSALVFARNVMTSKTFLGWANFCRRQREDFERRYISKLTETPRIERS